MSIDWDTVAKSFDLYFAKLGKEGTCIEIDGVVHVFAYDDMKFENEDNWGDENE